MNENYLNALSDQTLVCALALQSALTPQEYDSIAVVLERIHDTVLNVAEEKRLEPIRRQESLDDMYSDLIDSERDLEYAKEEWLSDQRQQMEEKMRMLEEGFAYRKPPNCS